MSFTGAGFRTPSVPVVDGKMYDAQLENIGQERDGVAPGQEEGDEPISAQEMLEVAVESMKSTIRPPQLKTDA